MTKFFCETKEGYAKASKIGKNRDIILFIEKKSFPTSLDRKQDRLIKQLIKWNFALAKIKVIEK